MEIIAGYEFVIAVDFQLDGTNVDWRQGHTAELLIHYGARHDVYAPSEYTGNSAKWYLSPAQTRALKDKKFDGKFELSVDFYVNGDVDQKEPAIHRMPLLIKE